MSDDDEANEFAMALLMPEALVRDEVNKIGGLDLANDKAVKKLADKFQVPIGIMAMRLVQLK